MDKIKITLVSAILITIWAVLVIIIVFNNMLFLFPAQTSGKPPKASSEVKPKIHVDPVMVINAIQSNMAPVKGGTFYMGCNSRVDSHCRSDEQPSHKVTVGNFYLSKYCVTITQFELFINETGYRTDADKDGNSCVPGDGTWVEKSNVNWRDDQDGNRYPDDLKELTPVCHVSWNDANAYCRWLSAKTGKHYRLPTEAEWEYAARGGSMSKGYQYSGGNDLDSVGWYSGNSNGKMHPVGQKIPNELGLFDMTGNAWNWCSDWYGKDYYKISPQNAPTGPPTGEVRILRGGSWYCNAITCRITVKIAGTPNDNGGGSSFRIARDY